MNFKKCYELQSTIAKMFKLLEIDSLNEIYWTKYMEHLFLYLFFFFFLLINMPLYRTCFDKTFNFLRSLSVRFGTTFVPYLHINLSWIQIQ